MTSVTTMAEPKFGVIFTGRRHAVEIGATWRADLHLDRIRHFKEREAELRAVQAGMKKPSARRIEPTTLGVITVPTEIGAAKLAGVLQAFWRNRGRVLNPKMHGPRPMTFGDVLESIRVCRLAWGFTAVTVTDKLPAKSVPAAGAHGHDIVERHLVEDPSASDAEVLHRALTKGATARWVDTEINMSTLIGGVARYEEAVRDAAHEMAAKQFRVLHDSAMIGLVKAIDPSLERVDGGVGVDVLGIGMAARRKHSEVVAALGPDRFRIVEMFVVNDLRVAAIARRLYGNDGGNARMKATDAVNAAMDALARHLGYLAPERSRFTSWDDDSQQVFSGEIVNQKRASAF